MTITTNGPFLTGLLHYPKEYASGIEITQGNYMEISKPCKTEASISDKAAYWSGRVVATLIALPIAAVNLCASITTIAFSCIEMGLIKAEEKIIGTRYMRNLVYNFSIAKVAYKVELLTVRSLTILAQDVGIIRSPIRMSPLSQLVFG